ncbi:Mob1/phocein [Schizopora paradoxa]|uniref:Mob1/phocein n=1 Tax=Schizopora paradoxa TaxID=27342 RepID=A0A0H2R2K4_9AGAM|nr:Mob1/phocein [Schizopora paradoxa]
MSVAVQAPCRPLRGSRLEDFYPPIPTEGPSLSNLESAFQLQEYISLLVRQNPHDVETIVATPEKVKSTSTTDEKAEDEAEKEGKTDIVVEESSWIYEQLRRLAQDLTHPLITSLQLECTRSSCPEMKAGEWLYLCVAHGQEGALEQCCAIDYIIHTLDSATALLNSPRAFPSRLTIPPASVRHFPSLARRLGRIFAHAYFHHREAFEHAEAESSLYARFLALTERFKLVPAEFLVIPSQSQSKASEDTEAPRLPAAMGPPTPATESTEQHSESDSGESASSASSTAAETQLEGGSDVDAIGRRSESPEKPSLSGMESPRKMGRSRTDTMIFSDAAAYSEELRASGSGSRGISSIERSPARPSGRELWEESTPSEKEEPESEETVNEEPEIKSKDYGLPTDGEEVEGKDEEIVEEPKSEPSPSDTSLESEEVETSHSDAPAVSSESLEGKEIVEISAETEEEHPSTTDSVDDAVPSAEEPHHEVACEQSEEVASNTEEEEKPKEDDAAEFVVVDEPGNIEESEVQEREGGDAQNESADRTSSENQEAASAAVSDHDAASTPQSDAEKEETIGKEENGDNALSSEKDDVPELVPQ